MAIKLVTFDFTRTLVYIKGSVGNIYAEVANRYYLASGIVLEAQSVGDSFKKSYKTVSVEFPCFGAVSGIDSETWWLEVVKRTLLSSGLKDQSFFRSISNQLYTGFSTNEHWAVFSDVHNCLTTLKNKGLMLGIISNFDERLPTILQYLGLYDMFDFILCSGVIGVEKPSPAIFEAALALANVYPKEAVHVGDSFELDFKTSRELGIKSILLQRGGAEKQYPTLPQSCKTVFTLKELPSLLYLDS